MMRCDVMCMWYTVRSVLSWMSVCLYVCQLNIVVDADGDDVYIRQRKRQRWKTIKHQAEKKTYQRRTQFTYRTQITNYIYDLYSNRTRASWKIEKYNKTSEIQSMPDNFQCSFYLYLSFPLSFRDLCAVLCFLTTNYESDQIKSITTELPSRF